MSAVHHEVEVSSVPSVVVVGPRVDAYKSLAASARLGKMTLHFRSSGAAALQLARRMKVDAWLIAPELDDMAGQDLVPLLETALAAADRGTAKVALVQESGLVRSGATPAEAPVSHPVTFAVLEHLLGMAPEQRAQAVAFDGPARAFVTLPVSVGAAVLAIAVLMMG